VYQQMRLYEFSGSMKLLLTGFILAACAAVVFSLAGVYFVCKGADGRPQISFRDIEDFIRGTKVSVLEYAADNPKKHGLGSASKAELDQLKQWCEDGAPRREFLTVRGILTNSVYDVSSRLERKGTDGERQPVALAIAGKKFDAEYARIKKLARRRAPISDAELSIGIALYLSVTSLVFLGLGMLFVRTSMFEKRKVFFVGSAFAIIAACPGFLFLSREHTTSIYLLLLSLLLLTVCFGVFAIVSLFDIWFRRTVT
jgi:hypothetical protein